MTTFWIIGFQHDLVFQCKRRGTKKQKAGVPTPAFLTRTKTTSSKSVDFAAPQLIAFPLTRKPAFCSVNCVKITRTRKSRQSPVLVTKAHEIIYFANADF